MRAQVGAMGEYLYRMSRIERDRQTANKLFEQPVTDPKIFKNIGQGKISDAHFMIFGTRKHFIDILKIISSIINISVRLF